MHNIGYLVASVKGVVDKFFGKFHIATLSNREQVLVVIPSGDRQCISQ